MCDDERTPKAEKQERQNQYWSLLIFVWDATGKRIVCRYQQNERDTISIDLGQRSFRLIENVVAIVLGRLSTINIEKLIASGK